MNNDYYSSTGENVALFTYFVWGQNLEGSHDLFCSVSLSGLAGHEVDEGLEGHNTGVVGVHQSHDTSKLHLTLSERKVVLLL